MDAQEWIRRQARAKDEVYDLINTGGIDNLLRAVDVAWKEYCNFTGPMMMTAGKKTERAWRGLSDFAKRMVVDSACALAHERSKLGANAAHGDAKMGVPNKEGFWWGKWRIADDGTFDQQPGVSAEERDKPPGNEWEVMHVVDNNNDDDDPLMVMVPGVSKWQSIQNFVWGPGPLEQPKTAR